MRIQEDGVQRGGEGGTRAGEVQRARFLFFEAVHYGGIKAREGWKEAEEAEERGASETAARGRCKRQNGTGGREGAARKVERGARERERGARERERERTRHTPNGIEDTDTKTRRNLHRHPEKHPQTQTKMQIRTHNHNN